MKTKIYLLVGGLATAALLLFWVSTPTPTAPKQDVLPQPDISTMTDPIQEMIDAKRDLIVVDVPQAYATVTTPLQVTGKARGYWYFEASFPIIVTDWDGLIIGEGYATAEGDWMTEDFVPFTATVDFTLPPDTPYRRGTIIFKKDNPSGLPEHDDALEIPVQF